MPGKRNTRPIRAITLSHKILASLFLAVFFIFLSPGTSRGEVLPPGTISIITNAPTTASTTLLSSNTTTTIISFYVNHPFNGETDILYCGNTPILTLAVSVGNYQEFPVLEFLYTCNKNIYYKNGSANDDTIILNYLNYDYTKTISGTGTSTSTNSLELISSGENSFYLDKKISYGELFTLFFLTIFLIMFIFDFLYRFIFKIKVNFRH